MFHSTEYPKSLDESLFDQWLEQGRNSKMSYAYLLVIWDELEGNYFPAYVTNRHEINRYPSYGMSTASELLVAAYDLYSEARLLIDA